LTIPDPVLLAALDAVLDAAARHDLVTGIYAGSPESALMLARRGFRLVTAAQDTALLQTAVATAGAQLRAGLLSFS
jgi:2-keto-3-deoxy-L-rhamnonate aldolase RhmA